MSDVKSNAWQIDAAALGACLLLTGAVYFVGLKPMLDRETERASQQERLIDLHSQSAQLATHLNDSRATLTRMRKKIEDSAIQLQSTAHLNKRLADVTALATECGLQVNEIQPGSITRGERYETVPINLAGTGYYSACANFLHRLQAAFPDTGVSAFEMTGKPADPKQPAGFTFNLIWYAAPTSGKPAGN
ncbi:MAG: type 4a pilus biogenesis protein PilO [Planctomycetes bacterium]|nr:type 4a pilus biogenesis protein PilO [Planctomycetota bacterium]